MFKVIKTEGLARRGEFTCPHGTVQTPVFMNVGTQGAIKGALSAFDLKAHHYEGCYEITSLLGTIDTMDGQFYCLLGTRW